MSKRSLCTTAHLLHLHCSKNPEDICPISLLATHPEDRAALPNACDPPGPLFIKNPGHAGIFNTYGASYVEPRNAVLLSRYF